MMKKQNNLLSEELSHAGVSTSVTPLLMKLDGFRITPDTQVGEEEFLMRMYEKPCFPRRELTAVTGVEKCGKTVFTSMIMACCVERQVLALERIREQPLRVMWYDTEQSKQSTKSILCERIMRLSSGLDQQLFAFNVRSSTYQERMDMLIEGINTYHPDMVIIDNVGDLLPNINDAEESQKVISQLMELATLNDCNIVVVIHLNRSGDKRNLRGWLGTVILQKSYEVYCCEQDEKTDIYSVQQSRTRKYRIKDPFYYRISDDGLPVTADRSCGPASESQGSLMSGRAEAYHVSPERTDSFNQKYIIRHPENVRTPWEWDLRLLFDEAMGSRAMMSPDDLRQAVMTLSGIIQPKYYEKVLKLAEDHRIVQTTLDRNGRVVVITIPT